MNWTENQIHFIIQDLIEENPLACSGLFKVSAIEFSNKVDTMAVSIAAKPILYINLDFCRKHLECENDVKAVLLHEFLHVLLLHTEKYSFNSPLLNICLDAIINAIIYRNQGMEYAGFFARFYKWEKLSFLLRPKCNEMPLEDEWMDIHKRIYEGKYCADDLLELLEYLQQKMKIRGAEKIVLLGNHDSNRGTVSSEVSEVLDNVLRKMNGVKIWNKSKAICSGINTDKEYIRVENYLEHKWDTSTFAILKKCLLPDHKRKPVLETGAIASPVLTGSDKRSLSKYLWSGIVPFSVHQTDIYHPGPDEKAHVYLDVSGSMKAEIDRLVNLLYHFRKFIKNPIWVFSNDVKEAFFIRNKLEYITSYGTKIEPVFDHMRANKIKRALIVTDGYVERIPGTMLEGIDSKKIQVLISAEGNPTQFEHNKISYKRLDKLN